MDNTAIITIGGVKRQISSYKNLLLQEPGDISLGVRSLSAFQYNSMLFKNLGYNKCPKDLLWMEREIPIEEVPKTEVLDYPITRNKLMIIDNPIRLYDLLLIISNWIQDELERGHLMDEEKAFQLPSPIEIQYNYNNHIKIMKTANVKSKSDLWNKADIFTRRLFNLNPEIDSEYFEFSLSNYFEEAIRFVNISDPYAVFVSALMDPDIIMSAIRSAEKEAAHIVFNQNPNIPVAMIDINKVAKEFDRIMQIKVKQISDIYKTRGAAGFIDPQKEATRNQTHVVPSELKRIVPYPDAATLNLIQIVYNHMLNTPLDGDHLSYVRAHVEPGTLKFIDNLGEGSDIRILTYKRLFYTIYEQIGKNDPEAVSTKDKFILSEGFYINPQCFALYKKTTNKFYICDMYLNCIKSSPQQAVAYYNDYFGRQVLLNVNEVGDQLEAERCPEIDLTTMQMQAMGMYGQMYIQQPIQPQQIPQQQIPDNSVPLYGMNANTLVEGI